MRDLLNTFTCCIAVTLVVCGAQAHAHSSPQDAIASISKKLDERGVSARLLVQRAVEYRTLREYEAAKRDLILALRLEPANFMALRELAQVDLCVGEFDSSLDAIERALSIIDANVARFGLYALRAEVHGAAGRTDSALRDIGRALECERPEVDWYLQRSRLQWIAERYEERVRDLREGAERNPSVVIQHELTDALIDAGLFEESLARVEDELEKCRDCASWRIRRARIRLGLGDAVGAQRDLDDAIATLSDRLREQRNSPLDVTVIVERATAYALRGDASRAERGLDFARALEADEWLTAPLARLVDERSPVGD